MRALFVYRNELLPSSRIRILEMAKHLGVAGIDVECLRYPRNFRDKWALVGRSAEFDVVVLQKKLPNLADSLILRRIEAPMVFDFDDAIMFRDRPKNDSYESRTRKRRFDRVSSLASGLICGNNYLASLTKQLEKPQLVLPSAVPHHVPQRKEQPPNDTLRLGWVGFQQNLQSLEPILPVLRGLARTRSLLLTIVSNGPLRFDGCPVRNVPWSLEGQGAEIARFDVGLMPLQDSPWTRGKCAYKALQCMAAGVPVVASAVGMNKEVIRDGENGCLVRSDAEWRSALDTLLSDGEKRRALGEAARRTIEEGYTYELLANKLAGFLRHLRP